MFAKSHSALLIVGHRSTVNPDSSAPTLAHAAEIRQVVVIDLNRLRERARIGARQFYSQIFREFVPAALRRVSAGTIYNCDQSGVVLRWAIIEDKA